jgi:hypothetical protein
MLKKIFEEEIFTDITIKLDDGEIKAHKCVLVASEIGYFNKIFSSQNIWKETENDTIIIKEIPTELCRLLLKIAYEYNFSNQFDPQFVAYLIVIGSRFNYQKCFDKVIVMIKNLQTKRSQDWLKYVLKIFMRFSPLYDHILRDHLPYKVKQVSFWPGWEDEIETPRNDTIDYEIVRVVKHFKIKYIKYLAHLDNDHYLTCPLLKVLLQKYDNDLELKEEIYEAIVDLYKIVDVSLIEDETILELLEKYGFIDIPKKE